ncbi:MAG: carboxymuconolactone decarboxylase family protein [Isosphaeraceae bacterium]|nr:carboxymuconolactone decarboxylase family protein [Isosphaeraceae bacterium]
MSRLPLVDASHAEGKTKELLDAVKSKMGMVPNITKAMATAPALLEGYLGLSGALGHGVLDPKLRERLAIETAESNGCGYCLSAHSLMGKMAGLDESERTANRRGRSNDPKADAALVFARAVLEKRGAVSDAEFAAVRDAGFSDAEINEIIGHVGLNVLTNFFNNVAQTPIDFPVVPPLEG